MAFHYARQCSFLDLIPEEDPPKLLEVKEFINTISEFDEPLVKELNRLRGNGRNDYPVVAMWNLFAVSHFLRKGKISTLLEELGRNPRLSILLGFERKSKFDYGTPKKYVCSRFEKKLKDKNIQKLVQEIFQKTVKQLKEEIPELGKNIAIDASDISTWAKPHSKDGERISSDEDASWSVKTKKYIDEKGKKKTKTECTFGYKMYAATDTKHTVVLALETKTGSTSDFTQVRPMILQVEENLGKNQVDTLSLDKGFDSKKTVLTCYDEFNIKTVVPTRDVPKNLQNLPAEDREIPLIPTGNVVRDKYTGQVFCYDFSGKEPNKQEMVYAGFDTSRDAHKFRCPAAASGNKCPHFDRCSAGRNGSNSRQVRINMKIDPRRFGPIYPKSHRWKKLYRDRTSVERYNSYVKEVLRLNDHCVRGRDAVHLRVMLSGITVNIRALLLIKLAKACKNQAA